MDCPHCGVSNFSENAKYCTECGQSLIRDSSTGAIIHRDVVAGRDFVGRDAVRTLVLHLKEPGTYVIHLSGLILLVALFLLGYLAYQNPEIRTAVQRVLFEIRQRIGRDEAIPPSLPEILPYTDTWSLPKQIGETPYNPINPTITTDSDGIPHVIWQENISGSETESIFYSTYQNDSWSQPVNISQSPTLSRSIYPQVAFIGKGQLLAVWVGLDAQIGNTRSEIYFSIMKDRAWSEPEQLLLGYFSGIPVIATNENGDDQWQVNVASPVDTDGDLYADTILLRSWTEEGWSSPELLPLDIGALDALDMSIDSTGHVHIVWNGSVSDNSSSNNQYDIFYSVYDGRNWELPINISQSPTYSSQPAITVDSMGNIHILWIDGREAIGADLSIFSDTYYRRFSSDSQWNKPQILSSQRGVLSPRANADSYRNAHLLWLENNSTNPQSYHFRLRYCRWDGQKLLLSYNIVGSNTASGQILGDLAISQSGNIWIVWSEGDENGIGQLFVSSMSSK